MSTGNPKRRTGLASRLLALGLVGLALLILLAAGVYSRPRESNVVTIETGTVRTVSDGNQVAPDSEVADDKKSSQTKALPPSPPTPPTPPSDPSPAQPPQPPQPLQPSHSAQPPQPPEPPQAAQPAQPAQPAEPAGKKGEDFDKPDKDKSSKQKSKDKVKKGELIEAPRPTYPDEVRQQKIEGIVAVVITIGNDGNVIYAKADSGPKELYAVSEAAALKARFKPTLKDGQPVKVTGVMTYNFVLDEKE